MTRNSCNKDIGNRFEEDLADALFGQGFWVHRLQQNSAGQPADIIAVKNRNPFLIDCKECSNDKFPLSRIESNQFLAMALWKESGNGEGWFALRVRKEEVYMIDFRTLLSKLNENVKTLNYEQIVELGTPLERWIK